MRAVKSNVVCDTAHQQHLRQNQRKQCFQSTANSCECGYCHLTGYRVVTKPRCLLHNHEVELLSSFQMQFAMLTQHCSVKLLTSVKVAVVVCFAHPSSVSNLTQTALLFRLFATRVYDVSKIVTYGPSLCREHGA